MNITLDYVATLAVDIDTETGKVSRVGVNAQDFAVVNPEAVFNGDLGEPGCEIDEEYLPLDHPLSVAAIAIADRVEIVGIKEHQNGYVEFTYRVKEES